MHEFPHILFFFGICGCELLLPAKKLLQLQLRFLRSGRALACPATPLPTHGTPLLPHTHPAPGQFNLEQSGAIKCKNAKHIRAKCTPDHDHQAYSAATPHWISLPTAKHPPPRMEPWPCHLLNEMSSKLAVNLFAIFLLLFSVLQFAVLLVFSFPAFLFTPTPSLFGKCATVFVAACCCFYGLPFIYFFRFVVGGAKTSSAK